MLERTIDVHGVRVPTFIYGTAWKEERTAALTRLALREGFAAIDTANQRKHYVEAGVGEALVSHLEASNARREDVFVQTKFTFRAGQDHRLPYDPDAPWSTQVRQSFERSLEHLQVDHIDSYVLHGPSTPRGLRRADWEAWRAMEELHRAGRVHLLGVSNVSAAQLSVLCNDADVPPAFVQNRCYAIRGWDEDVREVAGRHGVTYQGFSLLTANAKHLSSPPFLDLVDRTGRTPAQLVFRAAQHMGILPLTGTTDVEHMRQDLSIYEFELEPADIAVVESVTLG